MKTKTIHAGRAAAAVFLALLVLHIVGALVLLAGETVASDITHRLGTLAMGGLWLFLGLLSLAAVVGLMADAAAALARLLRAERARRRRRTPG